MSKRKH